MSFQRGGRQQCRFFSSGRSCPYGNKCRFPHDPQNPQTLGPTANGRPSRSTSTSHQQEDERPMVPIANTRPTRATGPRGGNRGRGNAADQRNHAKNNPDNPQRKELNAWSYSLRHPGRGYIRDKSAFFVKALDLVNQDAAARQEVVSQLASDEGLQRIAQLQDDSEDWGPSPKEYFFRKRMLPLFQILSHGEVTSSLILEMSTATILNVLFGPSGARAISIFQFAADALSEVAASTDHDTSLKASALRATLAALSLVVDLNSTAIVVKELRKILEEIIKVLDYLAVQEGEHVARVSRPYMKRLKKQFAIGSSIPEPQTGPARVGSRPVFNLEIDGPGVLSPDGPRHDNDHENIEDISILPTESEIRAHRAEYLPTNDGSPHHRTGTKRLADLHFRLLREDTVGPLRDAVRIELGEAENPSTMHGAIRTSQQAAKTYVHSMAFLHHVHSHKSRGLELIYGIPQPPQFKACPPAKRRSLWEVSKRLQVGALLCILTRDGQATFCSVSHNGILEMKRNDKDKAEEDALPQWANLFDSEGTAFVALSVIDPKECTLAPLLENYGAKDSKSSAKLIEFPGVLLAAFESTLRALQTISKSEDLPFSEVLAPTTTHDMVIYPPEYMMEPGFNMQLQCLTTDSTPLTLSPSQRLPAQLLQQHSSLDETQAKAVIDSLSREVALVQGPPGTGKSYTGVAIIRALLANEQKANLAPIVCVCYTNHALDQLLEQLVDSGVNNVVRIGSQSKSEKLKDLNLREISRRIDQTTFERRQRSLAMENVNAATKRLNYELSKYIQASTASSVEQYLKEYQGEHFEELFMKPNVDEEGFQEVTHRQDPVQAWLSKGASKEYLNPRTVDELQETSLALMTQEERRMLHGFWTRDCRDRFSDEIRLALEAYLNARKVLDTCRTEIDLRSLKQALVIGVTTTGLARILKLLKTLGPKILVCEEAGEVLEAHSLATLLPTIQHAIFIGDHLQLKPQIQNFDLSSENPAGKRFSLDRSLFERLIKTAGLPLSTLQTQRRMDPSISDLIRSTLYPNLEDHAVVKSYPEICGLTKRLFWFNHDAPEQQPSEGNMASTSHVNHFEVQMVEAVTSHLLKQGQYGPNEIAILTPYLGQLRALRDALGRSMTIQLEERDQAEMEAQGIEVQTIENSFSQIKQTTLGNAVRIATVDNFQGEEAKFVIVSLVRSNQYRKCGFLRTTNRINVLLSRAKHGMLVIGNAYTASSASMWRNVIDQLKSNDNFGEEIDLSCPRHPQTSITVRTPQDFQIKSPEGGCNKMCPDRLTCGHPCDKKCHSAHLHRAVHCLENCQRSIPGCDEHSCPRYCGDPCPKQCGVLIKGVALPCGHVRDLPCWEAKDPTTAKCRAEIKWTLHDCGHTVDIHCFKRDTPDEIICSARCSKPLPCGHACIKPCKLCLKNNDGEITYEHGQCKQICGRPYSTCSHMCKAECHGDNLCPLCTGGCQVRCVHSKCSKQCSKPCSPCAVAVCTSRCPHSQCDLPCSAPCSWLPCSRRCATILECGHRCPSACGEVCPSKKYCQECSGQDIKNIVVDYIEFKQYREVDLDDDPCLFLDCGHVQARSSLDSLFDLKKHYEMNEEGQITAIKKDSTPFSSEEDMKVCPECRGSLRSLSRYGRIVKRAILDESTKRLITWAQREFTDLAGAWRPEEENLERRHTGFISNPPKFVIGGSADHQQRFIRSIPGFRNQYTKALDLRTKIAKFKHEVRKEEQPYQRVFELVESARRRKGVDANDLPHDVQSVQMRHYLLASNLLLRCDLAILNAALEWRKAAVAQNGMDSTNSEMYLFDLAVNRQDCEAVIAGAQLATQPAIETEAHILYGLYAALERSTIPDSTTTTSQQIDNAGTPHEHTRIPSDTDLRGQGFHHIGAARLLREQYPSQTQAHAKELDEAEEMLHQASFNTVSSKERYEVMKAMAQEFRGTGHWYHCSNGHPFTIGECGMPVERAICPQCGAQIGGLGHENVEGVGRHEDWEREFANLRLS